MLSLTPPESAKVKLRTQTLIPSSGGAHVGIVYCKVVPSDEPRVVEISELPQLLMQVSISKKLFLKCTTLLVEANPEPRITIFVPRASSAGSSAFRIGGSPLLRKTPLLVVVPTITTIEII